MRTSTLFPTILPAALLLTAPTVSSQNCEDFDPGTTTPDAGLFEHVWSGLIYDVFLLPYPNGTSEVWTVEDGGRIRHRDTLGNWDFQSTPTEVDHTMLRVHFLDNGLDGWACGEGGWLISTDDGGSTWEALNWVPSLLDNTKGESLYDVYFIDTNRGWLLGKHGFWTTDDGGMTWCPATFKDDAGNLVDFAAVELYAFDIYDVCEHECGCQGPPLCDCQLDDVFGLAVGEPGIVWRTVNGDVWKEVFDLRDLCPCEIGNTDPDPFLSDCLKLTKACGIGALGMGCSDNPDPEPFEPWDVEIRHSTGDPLAIFMGGVTTSCGFVFASDDWGCSWTVEEHACQNDPANCQPDVNGLNPVPVFTAMYGVGIYDGDGSAIGAGYLGQHVRRPSGAPGTVLWYDHSITGDALTAPGALNFPMYGADADEGSYGLNNGEGYLVGSTNHIRTTVDGGENYIPEAIDPPEEFRIHDVEFTSDTDGWQCGQFWRLAKTVNGGVNWTPDPRLLNIGDPYLQAIAFADDGSTGVSVGKGKSVALGGPKRLWTGNNISWNSPMSTTWIGNDESFYGNKNLAEVAWAPDPSDSQFWTVGQKGLILRTVDGGQTWNQVKITGLGFSYRRADLKSVAFASSTIGIFAGTRLDTGKAFAARYNVSTNTWTDISPPSALNLDVLMDVDIIGSRAFAVGAGPDAVTTRRGLVVESTGGAFFQSPGFSAVPECHAGDAASDLQPLTEIEILSLSDIWVGGQCGQMWHYDGSIWNEVKSQTSVHIRGMSCPSPDACFIACHRESNEHICVTGLKQQ